MYRAKTLRGEYRGERVFRIAEGEDIQSVAKRLEADRLVSSRWYFLWSAFRGNLRGKVPSGSIVISGNLTAPEVVATLLQKSGKPEEVTLTFPEGWTIEKMASRLSANEFDGDKFVELARNPLPEWREAYPILASLLKMPPLKDFCFQIPIRLRFESRQGVFLRKCLGIFLVVFRMICGKKPINKGKLSLKR
ncbi:MAG: endolytic transglycosylase MltG [Candidatus Moraniibacteriota bacterium]|nr:MAG: endolytic transglycosylase MltG [Candidatus Moranbacteria bacterium]